MAAVRRLLMFAAVLAVLLGVLQVQEVHAGPPPQAVAKPGAGGFHWHMPHWHWPHLSPQAKAGLEKVKGCVKVQLKKLPGAVVKILWNCLGTLQQGPASFITCVASKGIMSGKEATNHFATCAKLK